MKEKLLYVTKGGGSGVDEGFPYVVGLAKTLNAAIAVLMVHEKKTAQTYEDLMAAVAFAEAGDHETARRLMEREQREMTDAEANRVSALKERCGEASVEMTYGTTEGTLTDAISGFLKAKPSIEMVLISPGFSSSEGLRELKRLLKKISRPVVTIARPSGAGA